MTRNGRANSDAAGKISREMEKEHELATSNACLGRLRCANGLLP